MSKKPPVKTPKRINATDMVYRFIVSYRGNPTYDEIAQHMEWRSRNTAYYHVQKLIKEGKVFKNKKGKICNYSL